MDDETEALAEAIDAGRSPTLRRKRGVSIEWAERIEAQLNRIERRLDDMAGKAQPMVAVVDERGRFMPGTGWIGSGRPDRIDETQLELDPDPEPLSAYDALSAMRRTLRPATEP